MDQFSEEPPFVQNDNNATTPETPFGYYLLVGTAGLIFLIMVFFTQLKSFISQQVEMISETSQTFVASPTPTPSPTKKPFQPPSAQTQKWLIAAGGIISVTNQEGMDRLKAASPPEKLRPFIEETWDVNSHDTAIAAIDWLTQAGHSEQFDTFRQEILTETHRNPKEYERLKLEFRKKLPYVPNTQDQDFLIDFTWTFRDYLSTKSLHAWDDARIINLSRWSYSLGYLTEEEAWTYMLLAGRRLQQEHVSWEDFGAHYLNGRSFWKYTYYHPDVIPALDWLERNPKSPWKTIPWDTTLE